MHWFLWGGVILSLCRNGKRKTRNEITNWRRPDLGYYLIVTDTEGTERLYFNGITDSIKDKVGEKLIIKVVETKNRNVNNPLLRNSRLVA